MMVDDRVKLAHEAREAIEVILNGGFKDKTPVFYCYQDLESYYQKLYKVGVVIDKWKEWDGA
jgi:hypothetical protein